MGDAYFRSFWRAKHALSFGAVSYTHLGDYIVEHKAVDFINFTGSTPVGENIGRLAAMRPVSYTHLNIDLTTEPLGFDDNGQAVYLEDVMPSREEIETYVDKYVTRQLFQDEYANVFSDSEKWNAIPTEQNQNYKWNQNLSLIHI